MQKTAISKPQLDTTAKGKTIPYCQHSIDDAEVSEVVATLRSGWLTTGPKTLEFEEAFAKYVGSRYAVAVSSCTAGLHLALRAAGIESGDEVITTPLTFCSTAEVIEYCQARPVFADVQRDTFNIDPARIEEKITPRTRAIMPVHYGGIPCDVTAINEIARRHNLVVIEDAAHAAGSRDFSHRVGNSGNTTVFSFYPTKNMTTVEGGIITTNDQETAERLKILSLHGISKDAWKRYSSQGQWYYEIHHLGYKYNFTDLQAALGIQQLKKLDDFNATRERYARIYSDALADVAQFNTPVWYNDYFQRLKNTGYHNSWHLFVLMLNLHSLTIDRAQFIEEMKERGVGASVHFIPLHLQPFYARKYGYNPGDFPVAESIYDCIVSIPLYPKLQHDEVLYIVATLRDIAKTYRR